MISARKSFSLILICILATSSLNLFTAKPTFAQTPSPTVPEFTVQLTGPSYTMPTTYSLNQSSGQTVAQIGYTNEYSYVELTITNQPFNNSAGNLYYDVQIKEHNETENWIDIYQGAASVNGYPSQSTNSNHTIITLGINNQPFSYSVPAGSQIDIQVKAMLGIVEDINPSVLGGDWAFEGSTSAWSNTETVTIPANIPLSPTPAPLSSTSMPTSTPTVPELSWLAILPLLLSVFFVAVIVRHRKQLKKA